MKCDRHERRSANNYLESEQNGGETVRGALQRWT